MRGGERGRCEGEGGCMRDRERGLEERRMWERREGFSRGRGILVYTAMCICQYVHNINRGNGRKLPHQTTGYRYQGTGTRVQRTGYSGQGTADGEQGPSFVYRHYPSSSSPIIITVIIIHYHSLSSSSPIITHHHSSSPIIIAIIIHYRTEQ